MSVQEVSGLGGQKWPYKFSIWVLRYRESTEVLCHESHEWNHHFKCLLVRDYLREYLYDSLAGHVQCSRSTKLTARLVVHVLRSDHTFATRLQLRQSRAAKA